MKLPKKTKRHCPFCNKHTEHKISQVSTGAKRGAMKRGSIERAKKRGLGRGFGNKGKWGSKPAVSKFKRKTKSTKKTNTLYTCQICKKSHYQKKGKRTGKVQIEAKENKQDRKEKQNNVMEKGAKPKIVKQKTGKKKGGKKKK